jgi:hypothetical protein
MAGVGTVEAGVFMAEDFLAMPGSRRQVVSRMQVVMVRRLVVIAEAIEPVMAVGVSRMRRGMGCRGVRTVAGWVCRLGGRGFIIAGAIGGVDMGMGLA